MALVVLSRLRLVDMVLGKTKAERSGRTAWYSYWICQSWVEGEVLFDWRLGSQAAAWVTSQEPL